MDRRPGPPRAGASRRSDRQRVAPAPPPSSDPSLVLLGEFGRPHGLGGEVRLKSFTAEPGAIAGYGPLRASDGRLLTLDGVRPAPGAAPDMLIARVAGIRDRTGAEGLNRLILAVPRDRLAPPEEDEFYLADLIGLTAVDEAGTAVGRVVAVQNYGGGDLLEIAPAAGGATALLPFTKAFVPRLDLAGGRLVVAPPEDLFAAPGPPPPEEA